MSSDPLPCDTCPKYLRCQRDKLACRALLFYIRGASLERIRLVPRQPTRELMAELARPPKARRVIARRPIEDPATRVRLKI